MIPLHAVFPGIVDFPFGVAAVFLMYWNFVTSKNSIRKVSVTAVGISGFFVIISVIVLP